ncbi:Bop2p KNAG_0F02820 [Huiozyma naganishii CBS 8797]|uniref:Uncharacterized protein n=1 Tax=Huiozyma naganishii (strain ATCC MYA-139 / BCRC 22969 / CBS 8797 / KCTC 17520 / NBRC 10181 / NCYC 3082 / Yp74L-3) TaxID=1071383 RepID=J7S7E9_HUIN7|nr:hypothetical protein KNAG_0F02820 [Kazachstania naganishii CBS 8797]CCK70944.1 hypothetical protein KNAG_0F02820 [Kazachstania naganishii CBS 8797]
MLQQDTLGDGEDHYTFDSLPPEIIQKIAGKLDIKSKYFLVDYTNVLKAIGGPNKRYKILQYTLIEQFKSQIEVIDLTTDSLNDKVSTPLLDILRTHFISEDGSAEDRLVDSTRQKTVLIVDDSTDFEQLPKFVDTVSLDLIYCPFYNNSSINKILMKFPLQYVIDNLILEFKTQEIFAGRNLFGVLDTKFFTFNSNDISPNRRVGTSVGNIQSPWLVPRCQQIILPSTVSLEMDYLTMDSFIYNIMENYGLSFPQATSLQRHQQQHSNHNHSHVDQQQNMSCIENIFHNFLGSVNFYAPNLRSIKFINHRDEETCNFIDVSTLMLNKFKTNSCPLKYLFKLHSFQNWSLPHIEYFSGHRFKYDETAMTGSTERLIRSIRDNVNYLYDFAQDETDDACPYFRVELFPRGTKRTKLLNWLPLEAFSMDSSYPHSTSISPDRNTVSDLSERDNNIRNYNKPVLCLKCDTLETLELKLLPIRKNHSIYIQGLFLPGLKELTLVNHNSVIKRPRISDKRNSIVMACYDAAGANVQNGFDADGISPPTLSTEEDDLEVGDIKPIGFSSWNYLPSCEYIHFTNNNETKQTNFIFKITNLKAHLPKINLAGSFQTFVSEKQKFIVV